MRAPSVRLWSGVVCLALCTSAGCIEDLDPRDVVRGPRILDIVADRPEINPLGSSTLRVILGGARGVARYRWFACVSSDATRNPNSLANFGEGNTFAGCYADAGMNLSLKNNPTATFVDNMNILGRLEALAMRADAGAPTGLPIPAGLFESILRDVGVTVGIGVEVDVDGVTLKGYKRLILSRNPRPNANPPTPRVRVNGVWFSVPSGEDSVCVPENGAATLGVARGSNVNLVPDSDEARWVESYRVLTASGQLLDRRETAFYSWYATAGSMGRQLTQSPIRDNYWSTPPTPGEQSLWVLLRDGHGGTSGCRFTLRVE